MCASRNVPPRLIANGDGSAWKKVAGGMNSVMADLITDARD